MIKMVSLRQQIFNLMSRNKFEYQNHILKQLRELGEVVSVSEPLTFNPKGGDQNGKEEWKNG
jgi:hypothetical protein